MILRTFPNIYDTFRGLVEELAYGENHDPLRWGVCAGYSDLLTVDIEDVLFNDGLHLDMASFTKSRWTRFLRRYFRDDFSCWIQESMAKLERYPSRPFVASYAPNLDTGHNYGGCLSSLQIRISPTPEVILYSRACQIDKIGFLDLALMHIVAREMNREYMQRISGRWVVSLGFISAISQIYYLQRFERPNEGHRLQRTLHRLQNVDYDSIKFGPLKRGRKRMEALKEFGEIPRSVPVSKLTLDAWS